MKLIKPVASVLPKGPRMAWFRRDIKDHPVPAEIPIRHQLRLPRVPYNPAMSSSRDGAPTTSPWDVWLAGCDWVHPCCWSSVQVLIPAKQGACCPLVVFYGYHTVSKNSSTALLGNQRMYSSRVYCTSTTRETTTLQYGDSTRNVSKYKMRFHRLCLFTAVCTDRVWEARVEMCPCGRDCSSCSASEIMLWENMCLLFA